MTIDGTDIITYGLRLLKVGDYYDLPGRKRILPIPGFGENDIKYEPQKISLKLLGKYTDQSTMATNIEGFKTLIKSTVKHEIVIPGHGLNFTGVFADRINTVVHKNIAEINITITIV
jgi:hypothetical protein